MATGAPSRAQRAKKHPKRKDSTDETLLLLFGDFVCTALWAMLSSTFAEAAEELAKISGLGEFALAVAITIIGIMTMGPLCNLFGGALFNPVHCAAFWIAKKGSLLMMTGRALAQIAGGLAGSYAALAAVPAWLQEQHFAKLPGGLKPGVMLEVGIAVELLLGLVLNIVVLYSTDAKNKRAAYWAPIVATICLIVAGSRFTGPSMNPAIAFSWWHHFAGHTWQEQVAVYWLAPFAGALVGGLLYRPFSSGAAGPSRAPAAAKAAVKAD